MTYESGKQLLTTFGGAGAQSNPLAVLVAGGLCGIVSWAMICELRQKSPLPVAQLTLDTRPHRLGQKHIPAELSDVFERTESAAREDRVLQTADVPGTGSLHGPLLCGERRILLVFRISEEAHQCDQGRGLIFHYQGHTTGPIVMRVSQGFDDFRAATSLSGSQLLIATTYEIGAITQAGRRVAAQH